ncbi:helix-turn-helix domain-containing protein [Pseudomonas corrugata]|uniref:helix-turn-helix domain-containing protein n=1 Tax=Pseudomonas corrugata TaxID=47879 RepID=UPI0006D8D4A5|nr:helix-turn-helix domain-containing protein [Pseudomonas corrugata]
MSPKKMADQQASHENTHVENTSNDAQLARLVPHLRQGPSDTFTIMRELNICRPGARICDLRASGYKIITTRKLLTDEWGRTHRGVAIYTLIAEPGQKVAA